MIKDFLDGMIELFIRFLLCSATFFSESISPFFVDLKKVGWIKDCNYRSLRNDLNEVTNLEDHRGDFFFPKQSTTQLPVVLFIHGGGFSYFSKRSHASVASKIAEKGALVFSINYRLSPKHPFPAGFIDVLHAYDFLLKNLSTYNGNRNYISVVGESAGGNFSLSLCLYLFGLSTFKSEESLPDFSLLSRDEKPKRAVIHCGHLEVFNIERYKKIPTAGLLAFHRMKQIYKYYFSKKNLKDLSYNFELANPLSTVEKISSTSPEKLMPEHFPEIFIPVGSADPVLSDSIRLSEALLKCDQRETLKVYKGENHAFYAFTFKKSAKECIDDIFKFIKHS